MAFALINALFTALFGSITRIALPRGWYLLRNGYTLIATHAQNPDARENVEARRAISQGTFWLLVGVVWLLGGLVTGALTLYFLTQVIYYSIPR
jgi:UPF0716 family protein affecting phage T7 exclusion